MRKNIILCGVGGQGIVLTSKLLAASAMAKGTFRIRARVCANSVLPEPVGPSIRMLLF